MDRPHSCLLSVLLTVLISFAAGCSRDGGTTTAGPAQQELSAAHILIRHTQIKKLPLDVTRSKEEALTLATEIAKKARAENADFEALAKEYSDGRSGPFGGRLPIFTPQQMPKPFSDATLKLEIGEVSDPVETELGYHIILREKVEIASAVGNENQNAAPSPTGTESGNVSAKHILVMYKGSQRAPANISRTKDEALARIQECLERTKKGDKFEDLAREYSDGPSGEKGGVLKPFSRGTMAPAFEAAAFACEVGKITDIVETQFGYHIIYRYR